MTKKIIQELPALMKHGKRLGDVFIGRDYPLREWTLRVKTACHGMGDYGKVYEAEPIEFDSYTHENLIKEKEIHEVIEKDPELIRLAMVGLKYESGKRK